MYRGANPTAKKSQHMLLAALNELLDERAYNDITISALCERSGISRQTFYKLFGSKENLLLFKLENAPFANQQLETDVNSLTLHEICERTSRYVIANYVLFQMLIENELWGVFYRLLHTSFASCAHSFINVSDEEQEYAAQFVSAGLCQLLHGYISQHRKPDEEELTRLLIHIMSGKIYRMQ